MHLTVLLLGELLLEAGNQVQWKSLAALPDVE